MKLSQSIESINFCPNRVDRSKSSWSIESRVIGRGSIDSRDSIDFGVYSAVRWNITPDNQTPPDHGLSYSGVAVPACGISTYGLCRGVWALVVRCGMLFRRIDGVRRKTTPDCNPPNPTEGQTMVRWRPVLFHHCHFFCFFDFVQCLRISIH